MTSYDETFFEYVNSGSVISAEQLLPVLSMQLRIDSVLDVGCAEGAWLSVWRSLGVEDMTGVDGTYVDRSKLLMPESCFFPHDLVEEFDVGRCYDLVQSLEVAEHVPKTSAEKFIASLVRHGDLVLFSAAAKGQGGDNHINEQNYEYWRDIFAQHQYIAIDYIRPLILRNVEIEPWYRYNTFLYASPRRFETLPACIRACRVSSEDKLRDISPSWYKFRKALIRLLPIEVVTQLAKRKERNVSESRRKTKLRRARPA